MPWDEYTSSEDYRGCENCKHTDCEMDEAPCSNCRTTFLANTPEYQEHPFLWESPNDNPVSHPSHYTQGSIECIQAMEAAYGKEATAHFCICNAFKYLWRTEHKNGMEDIDKALWYLNKYKELKASGE